MALEQARKAEERAEVQATRAPVMTATDREIAARVIARIATILSKGTCDEQPES